MSSSIRRTCPPLIETQSLRPPSRSSSLGHRLLPLSLTPSTTSLVAGRTVSSGLACLVKHFPPLAGLPGWHGWHGILLSLRQTPTYVLLCGEWCHLVIFSWICLIQVCHASTFIFQNSLWHPSLPFSFSFFSLSSTLIFHFVIVIFPILVRSARPGQTGQRTPSRVASQISQFRQIQEVVDTQLLRCLWNVCLF